MFVLFINFDSIFFAEIWFLTHPDNAVILEYKNVKKNVGRISCFCKRFVPFFVIGKIYWLQKWLAKIAYFVSTVFNPVCFGASNCVFRALTEVCL